MGQGTESCGGYDVDYDPYYEELNSSTELFWTCKDSSQIKVSKMTPRHLKGAIRVCQSASLTANFSCDSELWDDWIDTFESELESRTNKTKVIVSNTLSNRFPNDQHTKSVTDKKKSIAKGVKSKMKCHCGKDYLARNADLKRGWALSCSKSCAGIRREYGRPKAIKV